MDIGTGGVRGCAIDSREQVRATAERPINSELRRDPSAVLSAARTVLSQLSDFTEGHCRALSIAGTSGSLLGLDRFGVPVGGISLYSDRPQEAERQIVMAAQLPPVSRGASGDVIARMMRIANEPNVSRVTFEATFVASALAGQCLPADLNNALKAGCDPISAKWPSLPADLKIVRDCLPSLVEPGSRQGTMAATVANAVGFSKPPEIIAGTTDGCASALAAGLEKIGDAVTSLGTTLTLKVLSDQPVYSAPHGIYSHRILGHWLAGGASNAGGAILNYLFSASEIEQYSHLEIAAAPSAVRYVPLTSYGERFPVVDPYLVPNLLPRPDDDENYYLAILDSLVRWERRGYVALRASGAPQVRRLTAIGGGSENTAWMATRARDMHRDFFKPLSNLPAFGAARLARIGSENRT